MARIDDVSTNGISIKHLDTTKDIVITPMKGMGGPVQLNTAHTWTAKVSDWANYIGDYPVTIESNSIVVNSSEFTSLPAGIYHLEVWEEWIDSNNEKQRSIYPSPQRTIDFNIYRNITDLAEKEIKTIGFQDVVDQAVMNIGMNYVFKVNMIESDQTATVVQSVADGKNYVTFNIPRGVKGEQGNVGPAPTLKIGTATKLDPDQTPTANLSGGNGSYTLDLGIPQGVQGETNETATNALNLANSANDKLNNLVTSGRNYIQNSESITMMPPGKDNFDYGLDVYNSAFVSNAYCHDTNRTRFSFYLTPSKALPTARTFMIYWRPHPYTPFGAITVPANTTATQYYELTTTTPTSHQIDSQIFIRFMAQDTSDISYTITKLMLTIGDSFPDYQPAPEDAPSNNSQLVHKTDNETIAGDKTFVGNTTLATTTILEGNYGLRVTSSGIQKTTDGKTWVPANI